MKLRKFKGEVLSGHKQHAVEVPFDPGREWDVEPQPLWRGRRGFRVSATLNGFSFAGAIVPRQKKFYLLIDADLAVDEGAIVKVTLEPISPGG